MISYIEDIYNVYNPWMSPMLKSDYYSRITKTLSENVTVATNLTQELAIVNTESIQQMTDATKEFCKVGLQLFKKGNL